VRDRALRDLGVDRVDDVLVRVGDHTVCLNAG
jgi:hypothetical protein